jgi:uncharacterized protein YjbI with pentapeptide repeats
MSEQDERQRLIEQLRSGDHKIVSQALDTIRADDSLFAAALLGVDLSGADLSRANLSELNLMEASLRGANLSEPI